MRHRSNRRAFLKSTGLTIGMLTMSGCKGAWKRTLRRPLPHKPNIIFIMADDLGYGDLSCYGSTDIHTPHLDALTADGARWTQFYAASAVCTPSRISVLTGRYPARYDVTWIFPLVTDLGLPDDTVTLPRLLGQTGYTTVHIGKWHIGRFNWRQLGFDHALTRAYNEGWAWNSDGLILDRLHKTLHQEGARYLMRDGQPVKPSNRFLCDFFGDEALHWINHCHIADKPFFLNVWFYVPHEPCNLAPHAYVEPYQSRAKDDDLKYRSMVTCLDANVGRLVARLKELGIYDNTLILFTSDNGPSYQGSVGGLSGGKADLHEGGIRVPFITHWPNRIPAGIEIDQLGHTNDILPTCCAAAGVPVPEHIDGINLMPRLVQEQPPDDREPLFWQMDLVHWYPQPGNKPKPYATEVVRYRKWKLLARGGKATGLFDMDTDPSESANLIDRHPDVVGQLESELRIWLKEPRLSDG